MVVQGSYSPHSTPHTLSAWRRALLHRTDGGLVLSAGTPQKVEVEGPHLGLLGSGGEVLCCDRVLFVVTLYLRRSGIGAGADRTTGRQAESSCANVVAEGFHHAS